MIFGIQAIVLIVLLLRKHPLRQSNVFLALILFFFALISINIALLNILITYNKVYLFRYFQLELLYGIGPSLYFFTKSITDPEYRISRNEYIHFLPVVLEFIYFRTAFYRTGLDLRLEFYQNGHNSIYEMPMDAYTIVYLVQEWIGTISILIYSYLSVRILIRYRKWVAGNYSNLKNKSLGWLRTPVYIYSGFWLVWIILRSVDTFVFHDAYKEVYFLPTHIGISVITCWIGFKGYMKSQIEAYGFSKKALNSEAKPSNPQEAQKIVNLMTTNRPYLNPDLDLQLLSKLANMNPKVVSHIINHDLKSNFYEFVNKYRINEFKQRVQKKDRNKFTILAHAFESGFNSKSTFNYVFKKFTGRTPGEYYRQFEN